MSVISIIVPCYNEEKAVPVFYKATSAALEGIDADIEYIFVDDGSSDNTVNEFKKLASADKRVKYISFSRNFGKEAGMYAGMKHAHGDYIVIMDIDLQDPPELIPKMYDLVRSGEYDCAATRRVNRVGEAKLRSFFARCFYKLINKISDTEIVDGARDFRLMSRKMVNSILELSEYNRFSKGIFSWVGFKTKWLEYENRERSVGETKWSFWKLFKYSIEGIVSFSTAPLAVSSVCGVLFSIIALIGIIFVVVRQLVWGGSAYGWASLICIILLVSGVQLLCIGILGQYLSRTYMESKRRPIFIVKESNTEEADK